MVDWNGLYKWSMEYQDGTRPSNFKPMSAEDRAWLEQAMKAYTFNDADRLTQIIKQLKDWSAAGNHQKNQIEEETKEEAVAQPTEPELLAILEELTDLAELHSRSNLNLCLQGGMTQLLSLILSHESARVRKATCHLLTSITSNNRQVQEFASKSGAINLVSQFAKEETLAVKDAVFGSLAAWIKADNFEGKRRFIREKDGLEFMKRLFCDSAINQNFNMRLKKKVVNLIYDLVVNDDGIFEDNPFYVRQHFCGDQAFIEKLRATLANAQLSDMQELQYRDSVLLIIYGLHQYKPEDVGPLLKPALFLHRGAIVAVSEDPNADQDLKDMLAEELRRVDDAIAAPTRPFIRNFEADTEQDKVRETNKKQSSSKSTGSPANDSPKNGRPSQKATAENSNSPQRAAAAPQQDRRQQRREPAASPHEREEAQYEHQQQPHRQIPQRRPQAPKAQANDDSCDCGEDFCSVPSQFDAYRQRDPFGRQQEQLQGRSYFDEDDEMNERARRQQEQQQYYRDPYGRRHRNPYAASPSRSPFFDHREERRGRDMFDNLSSMFRF